MTVIITIPTHAKCGSTPWIPTLGGRDRRSSEFQICTTHTLRFKATEDYNTRTNKSLIRPFTMTDTIIYFSIPPKTSVNIERELPFMTPNNYTAPPKKTYTNSQKPQKKNIMVFADNYMTEFINDHAIHSALCWKMAKWHTTFYGLWLNWSLTLNVGKSASTNHLFWIPNKNRKNASFKTL